MAISKKRLDHLVAERLPEYTKRQIQSWIMQGAILVDDKPISKPGTMVSESVQIRLTAHQPKFVSRAGFKLEAALDHFKIDVQGLVALDAGISTGGFTDCLLQRGVKRVYGIDVGYGQVHEKIRSDPRLVLYERTNLRTLKSLPELVDLITLDLSFISVLKVMPTVNQFLKSEGKLVILIKPQFEAGRADIESGGIVKNPLVHERVIQEIVQGVQDYGFLSHGVMLSPIEGATGNKEFLAYFTRKS